MAKDPYSVKQDFGFTFEDPQDELINELELAKHKLALAQAALYSVLNTITPLLDNLMADPKKTTIKWPNRVEKVKEFKDKITNIVESAIENTR